MLFETADLKLGDKSCDGPTTSVVNLFTDAKAETAASIAFNDTISLKGSRLHALCGFELPLRNVFQQSSKAASRSRAHETPLRSMPASKSQVRSKRAV